MKIEDDPSITPGSVARSPLAIGVSSKDATDIFGQPQHGGNNGAGKLSPTNLPPLSLSSSTWSYNPTGGQSSKLSSTVDSLHNNDFRQDSGLMDQQPYARFDDYYLNYTSNH